MPLQSFVAYYRVSTPHQGKSGLGLEAQRRSVADFLKGASPLDEFTEIETGKGSLPLLRRPELQKALALCKKKKAVLVIASLDRLSRNVHFISGLMESGVDFRAVDLPSVTPLLLHIHAAMAEEEARKISERVRAALVSAKARGVRLGSPCPQLAAPKGGKASQEKAQRFAENILPIVREIQGSGVSSLADIAQALTARGILTQRGGAWYPTTVKNLLRRTSPASLT